MSRLEGHSLDGKDLWIDGSGAMRRRDCECLLVPRMDGDILDVAVARIADDDYNHVPERVLRERLAAIRGTRVETRLDDEADLFIAEVRYALTWPGDPEYGEEE